MKKKPVNKTFRGLPVVDNFSSDGKRLVELNDTRNVLNDESDVSVVRSCSLELARLQSAFLPHVCPPNNVQLA